MWKPIISIDGQLGGAKIQALHAALGDISDNVEFMLGELPKIAATKSLLDRTNGVCMAFRGTVMEVRSEILNLEDKLGLRPDKAPHDPDMQNSDPRVTLRFITGWFSEDLRSLHALVEELRGAGDTETKDGTEGLLTLLVTESATNILKAAGSIVESVDELLEAVEPLLSAALVKRT